MTTMDALLAQMEHRIFGQTRNIRLLLAAMLAGGHVLLEGAPGLGKTKIVRTMAGLVGASYRRIQFTPDLMPSDITGSVIFNMKENEFFTVKGPVFANIVLADEINRTPPKTQAALLEAMEERQVTIQGDTHPLPAPFFVIATQNPVEYEGTYPLPEAQLDRFLMKLVLDYPDEESEKRVLRSQMAADAAQEGNVEPVLSPEDLTELQKQLAEVVVEDAMIDYMAAIIRHTRKVPEIELGASPRAGVALLKASRAWALLEGRGFVTPDDVKTVAMAVLRHRLMMSPQAELEGITSDRAVRETLATVAVPR